MPSVQDILQAYTQAQAHEVVTAGGLSFIPPLVGLIRPHVTLPTEGGKGNQGSPLVKLIDYARPEYCSLWVSIPTDLIDSIDLLGKRQCEGTFYDYVRLTFKLPSSAEGVLLAGLLLQSELVRQSCECQSSGVYGVGCGQARDDVKKAYADYEWGACDGEPYTVTSATADTWATTVLVPKLVLRHGSQGTITPGHKTINHGFPAPNTFMPFAGWNP